MPALSDAEIRAEIRKAERSRKLKTMSDGGSRGQGRLVLLVRPMDNQVTAEWYAQSWRSGKRSMAKIGTYPTMGLADARLKFAREFAGQNVARPKKRAGTVADLFDGYVGHLQARGATSWREARYQLDYVIDDLGPTTLANTVSSADIVECLRPIYDRGTRSLADHVRGNLRAAFGWGIRSERDYRVPTSVRFDIKSNPAEGIPTEPKVPGTRWLTRDEYLQVWRWLEEPGTPLTTHYLVALRVIMACGTRVSEIAGLHASQWDSAEKLLSWATTKNGRPHVLPVPDIAAELLDSITPNEHGWLFPSVMDPSRPVAVEPLYCCTWRHRSRMTIAPFSNRDLRRTWKTLAGEAGLSKEDRDRLQNHGRWDVSTKHYDRYQYLPEKRRAMAVWSSWLDDLLRPDPARSKVRRIRRAA